jgi:hypothetical protein
MPVAYNKPLSHSHHVDLCGIECSRLPRFRSRPAIACALLPGAIVRKTVSLHLELAYRARSLYSGLDPGASPHACDSIVRNTHMPSQFAGASMSRTVGRRLLRSIENLGFLGNDVLWFSKFQRDLTSEKSSRPSTEGSYPVRQIRGSSVRRS